MYEELVIRLRKRAVNLKEKFSRNAELLSELMQAVDAIEERCQQVDRFMEEAARLYAKQPKWIPVGERMPEKNVRVLCACRANIFCVMKWDGVDWYENPTHVFMSGFVTYWMPLPQAPEEET